MLRDVMALGDLANLNAGQFGVAFQTELARLVDDLRERPALKEPRKLQVTLTVVPAASDEGVLDGAALQAQIVLACPRRRTRPHSVHVTARGFKFNDLSVDNVKQGTLDALNKTEDQGE